MMALPPPREPSNLQQELPPRYHLKQSASPHDRPMKLIHEKSLNLQRYWPTDS